MAVVTHEDENPNLRKAVTPYRVWVGEMETLGWTRPVHLSIGDDHVTFCGIPNAVALSKATLNNIKQNLFWASLRGQKSINAVQHVSFKLEWCAT